MTNPIIETIFYSLIETIYSSKGTVRFGPSLFKTLNDEIVKQFKSGIGQMTVNDLNHPDHLRHSLFESNIARFAAAKTAREVLDLNKIKNSSKDFAEFRNKANELNIKYNQGWLKAEYQTAQAVGQSSRDYYNHIENADIFPFLQFDTVGDGKVRDEHAKLDGVVVKAGSKEHDLLITPLGYNCRCRLRPLTESEVKTSKIRTENEILKTLKSSKVGNQSAYDVVKGYGFDINRAKTAQVFSNAQMYIKNFKETGLTFADYNLSKYADLKRSKALFVPINDNPTQWFNARIGGNMLTDQNTIRLKDYRDRPVLWSKQKFKFDQPQHALHAIALPDEVWLFKDGNEWKRNYVKFYNNTSVVVETNFGLNKPEEIIKARMIDKPDAIRKGLQLK